MSETNKYIHIWKADQAKLILPQVPYEENVLYHLWNMDFMDIYRTWHEDRYLLFFKSYPHVNLLVPFVWKHRFYEVHTEHDRLH